MGKRRQKPLLADQGILHLKSCFVQPSEESQLLTTVGGRQYQALVLASGNYGYGIPMTAAIKAAETAKNKADEELDPNIQIVREINGGVFSALELSKDRSGNEGPVNHEELSVAELVRSIGGARDAPLRKCDVVEDRESELSKDKTETINDTSNDKPDPEAEEFYASLGIKNPNEKQKSPDERKGSEENVENESGRTDTDNHADGIRDFYKSYTQYYYSQDPNPYGDQRLQFSTNIEPDENSNSNNAAGEQTIIQLARMAQMRARQAKAAAEALAKAKKAKALSSTEVIENEADIYDPLPMEVVVTQTADELGITVDTTLDQYWEFVKDDPHDFNRWIYLIQYAESKNNITVCRKVYSAFLPLFSYCFGYWKRYSDMEKKFNYYGRALTVLERGLEFIPLSVDLWLSYIKLFCEINRHDSHFQTIVREQYEKSLNTCGMEFRSDALWEAYIQWEEVENKKLQKAFHLYGRILQVPTRLFNRHWDNFQVLVRDHHPRDFLEKDEYEYLRKKGCKKLGLRYKEEPEYEVGEIIKPSKPEDKLMHYVKEKILKKMTKLHVICEVESDKRWVFEDRIRRPYFHTKPLDKYQLRNWEEYLAFEIAQGDHDRIVLLFERCVIACALYENFWCKYARYLEHYLKMNPESSSEMSVHFLKSQQNTEIGCKKDTEEEEKIIKDVQSTINDIIVQLEEVENKERLEISIVLGSVVNQIALDEMSEKNNVYRLLKSTIYQVVGSSQESLATLSDRFFELAENYPDKVASVGFIEATEEIQTELASPKLIGDAGCTVLPVSSGDQEYFDNDNSSLGFTTLLSVPEFKPTKFAWQEAVRDVYKRACIVHCPKKPALRLQWAAFEEELGKLEWEFNVRDLGNSQQAMEIISHVETWFPDHLEAKLFMIETQRRCGKYDEVTKLFEKYLNMSRQIKEYSLLTVKYAKFLHKEIRQPDKALKILRNGIKKDKGNFHFYSYVCDICYEKYPIDKKAPLAAIELALSCKEFSEEQRLLFVKRKLLFLQEHGDIRRYRDTLAQMIELQEIVRKRETEEVRKKEEERLRIGTINPHLLAFPVPDLNPSVTSEEKEKNQQAVPIDFEPIDTDHILKKYSLKPPEDEPPTRNDLKKVAPPEELNLSNYGYASKHPDYKLAEYMAHKEYKQLEVQGYPEHLKDTDEDKKSRKRKFFCRIQSVL